MIELDPALLFHRIARDVPRELHPNLLIVGSLAAAYPYRSRLRRQSVKTKDADVVIHPAGALAKCRDVAERLLEGGWKPRDGCKPRQTPEPLDPSDPARDQWLQAIRLNPPESTDYFVELLGLPPADQREPRVWLPCELMDGWYGVPCFRFMALLASGRKSSEVGIDHAAPGLMALANLLSHPAVGTERMSAPIAGRNLLRSAKDLGRVLALAYLATDEEMDTWADTWHVALERHFPNEAAELAHRAGAGLIELLGNEAALEEAKDSTSSGLLGGQDVDKDKLRITGQRLILDVIDPLRAYYPLVDQQI